MSCCGRASFATSHPAPVSAPLPAVRAISAPHMTVHFEYTGETGLTAVGPATGRTYRFDAPGRTLPVDLRDAGALSAVPHLRRRQRA